MEFAKFKLHVILGQVIVVVLLLTNGHITLVSSSVATSNIVNGGVYKIKSDSDQNVLTAADNGVVSKRLGVVKSDVWANSDEQKWTIKNSPTTVQGKQLRSLTSRKNANNNIDFLLRNTGTGSTATTVTPTIRYWEFIPVGSGKWQLKSHPDGKCLQSMGRTHPAEEKSCDSGARSQKWEFLICNNLRCSDRK